MELNAENFVVVKTVSTLLSTLKNEDSFIHIFFELSRYNNIKGAAILVFYH